MHHMFVVRKEVPDLINWLPVLIEPVQENYQNMLEAYADFANAKKLGCAVPLGAAVSYDSSIEGNTCTFCHFNNSENSDPKCKKYPDWARLQLGTLDCEFRAHRSRQLLSNVLNPPDSDCVIILQYRKTPIRCLFEKLLRGQLQPVHHPGSSALRIDHQLVVGEIHFFSKHLVASDRY